jgi:hypothetical protein
MSDVSQVSFMNKSKPIEVMALPVSLCTLTIDGKRLSSALFKQITTEQLIDEETGEVRGRAIGWLNIHQPSCPEFPHLHVLWIRGDFSLYHAIVSGPDHSSLYRQKQTGHSRQTQQLTNLMALILALKFHYQPSTFTSEERRSLKISQYTLPTSARIAHLLDALEEARTCEEREKKAWTNEASLQEMLDRAKQIQQQLLQENIRLAHATLYNHRYKRDWQYNSDKDGDDDDIGILKTYGPFDTRLPPARPDFPVKRGKWLLYTPGQGQQEVLWHPSKQPDQQTIQRIETILAEQPAALSLLLAQQTVERDEQAIHKNIEELKSDLQDLLTSRLSSQGHHATRKKATPSPSELFTLYQEMDAQFEEYTQTWQQSVSMLHELVQLFIVS